MNKPNVLSEDEIEAILKVSGVSACLPKEIKDGVCRSVAVEIVAYYEPLIQTDAISYTQGVLDGEKKAASEIFEEIEAKCSIEGNRIPIPLPSDRFIIRRSILQALKSKYLKNKSL